MKKDLNKTKKELIEELDELRSKTAQAGSGPRKNKDKGPDIYRAQTFLNSIVENIPDMIFVKEAKTLRFYMFNKAGEKLLGYNRECLLGKNDYDLFTKEQADFFTAKDREVIESKKMMEILEEPINTKKGPRILHTKKIPIFDSKGEPLYLMGISEDITEKKKIEEELRDSENRYKTLFDCAVEGIAVTDIKSKKFKFVNPTLCKMLGYKESEMVGRMGIKDLHPKEELGAILNGVRSMVAGERSTISNAACLRKDGKIIYVDISGAKLHISGDECIMGFFTDVTEKKKLLEDFVRTEKMVAVGTMAAGIAHEVKNYLAIIVQSVNFLESKYGGSESSRQTKFNMIKKAVFGADDIIRGLLKYSRLTSLKVRPCNINDVLDSALELVASHLAFEGIRVKTMYSMTLPFVMIDEGQMRQVFVNIVLNAVQAMPEGGDLTFRTYLMSSNDMPAPAQKKFKAHQHVVICEIQDTGCGIPQDILKRVFDPFFTTKAPGSGTGLGLSITTSILEGHRGTIDIESHEDKGSKVIIMLPVPEAL